VTPRADNWDLHWTEYSESSIANPAVAMRQRLIERLLRLGDAPARVLELGCGTGELAAHLLRHHPGIELLGLDVSAVGVAQASARVPRARFAVADLNQRQEANFAATHAVCSEVVEHIDSPVALLRNAKAWMQPGCRLVVTVPGGPMSAFDRHIGHRRHFTPADLRQVLEEAGYTVRECHGAGFPFFNLYRLTVIARGDRLITDVAGAPSFLARLVMRIFALLFRLTTTRRGWQTVAVVEALP